jgi:hypothetical protein
LLQVLSVSGSRSSCCDAACTLDVSVAKFSVLPLPSLEVLQDIQQSDADNQLVVSRSKLSIASISIEVLPCIDTSLADKYLFRNLSASSAERHCGQLCTKPCMALLQG